MKNISIIGVGKLGLCLALNLEKKGFNVIAQDINSDYIKSLTDKKFLTSEPFVNEFLDSSSNIEFTTEISEVLKNDIIFVVVRTPSTNEWKYDHSQIESVAQKLIELGPQNRRKDLIINSTTFPGYCDTLQKKLEDYNYYVSYNPEFIAQGSIIKDQLNCDMVLVGESDKYAGDIISKIYQNMCESNPKISRMSRTEAELCKLSINCFLTTKISFANMVGDIAERLSCDKFKILEAVGNDTRIGGKYLKPGFGFGGPCFPRDNRALLVCAKEVGIDAVLSKATDEMNDKHLTYQVENFLNTNPNKNEPVQIEYVTYKKDSSSIEESQQLKYAQELLNRGYKINILDKRPEVLNQINKIL